MVFNIKTKFFQWLATSLAPYIDKQFALKQIASQLNADTAAISQTSSFVRDLSKKVASDVARLEYRISSSQTSIQQLMLETNRHKVALKQIHRDTKKKYSNRSTNSEAMPLDHKPEVRASSTRPPRRNPSKP